MNRSYAFLDECPEHVRDETITLPIGTLSERVTGVCCWRRALLEGRLPFDCSWPPPEVAEPARKALEELNIARFCKDQPELVDELLKNILVAFSDQEKAIQAEILQRLRELEKLERIRLRSIQEQSETKNTIGEKTKRKRNLSEFSLDEEMIRMLREKADREVRSQEHKINWGLFQSWEERVRVWIEIASVFGDLGTMVSGRGWDLTQGVLQHTGWNEIIKLHRLIELLPEVRKIAQTLGRLHLSDGTDTVAERLFKPMLRLEEELREIRTPLMPAETRGVERSGSIERMLPVEASMLGHQKFRMLWHARRSENALMTYRVEGVEFERTITERELTENSEFNQQIRERGPILAIIDTSGSMHGIPEQTAKALVLEALRIAHSEKRRCILYNFSSTDQIVEYELSISPDGIGKLLDFLGLSFGGGTDPSSVMNLVLERTKEEEWARADVMFVSDGEWSAPNSLIQEVQNSREKGTKFHGIQIGNREHSGLQKICDPVHIFSEWVDVAFGGH